MIKSNKKGGEEIRNIRLFAFSLILLAVIFYILSIVCKPTSSLLSDVFILIAGSFLTTGFFSIILGFSDFVNYVSIKLRDIIVEHTYLKGLSDEKKGEIKKAIDSEIFGQDSIKTPDSLYTFVDEQMESLFKAPYRKEFHDLYYFYNSNNDQYLRLQNHTTYTLYRSPIREGLIEVPMGGEFDIEKSKNGKKEIEFKDLSVSEVIKINGDEFELKEREENENKGYFIKHSKNNKFIKRDFDVSVLIRPEGKNKIRYNYSIELNDEIFEGKNHVMVDILREQLMSKRENCLFLGVKYPTKDVYLSCEFRDDVYRTYAAAFAFDLTACIKRTEKSSVFVDIKEWLLPGHGAVITWKKVKSNMPGTFIAKEVEKHVASEGKTD